MNKHWNYNLTNECWCLAAGEKPQSIRKWNKLSFLPVMIPYVKTEELENSIKYVYKTDEDCFSIIMPKVSEEHRKIITEFLNNIQVEVC